MPDAIPPAVTIRPCGVHKSRPIWLWGGKSPSAWTRSTFALLQVIAAAVHPTNKLRCESAPEGVYEPAAYRGSHVPQGSGPGGEFEERPLRGANSDLERLPTKLRLNQCRNGPAAEEPC
jgi:hypothetical protein